MNKKLVERTRKMSRHRQFLEERAQAEVKEKALGRINAQASLAESQSDLNMTSQWKSTASIASGLDLTLYQQALHFESIGIHAVEAASMKLDTARDDEDVALRSHMAARNGTRVANARLDRVCQQWRLRQEHAISDQAADLWLANKEKQK